MRASVWAVALTVMMAGAEASAVTYSLPVAEQGEIVSLAQRFFASIRDGSRTPTGVYPTAAEIRAMYPAGRDAEALVQGHLAAIERDVRELRTALQGATVGAVTFQRHTLGEGAPATRAPVSVEVRPCSRLARADSQCANGLVLQYTVGTESRRLRIDAVARVGGHWRILDLR